VRLFKASVWDVEAGKSKKLPGKYEGSLIAWYVVLVDRSGDPAELVPYPYSV
jgi:hypothetical protein